LMAGREAAGRLKVENLPSKLSFGKYTCAD